MSNAGPGYARNPDHKVTLRAEPARARVTFAGETIADTTRAVIVDETGLRPVAYIPKADARMDLLEPTALTTYCPYKGQARYWTIRIGAQAGDHVAENAVWAYDSPYDEVAALKDRVAFYRDRVDEIVVDAA